MIMSTILTCLLADTDTAIDFTIVMSSDCDDGNELPTSFTRYLCQFTV